MAHRSRTRTPAADPLTAGRRLHVLLFTAASETLLHHHVEVSEDDEGEGDVEAVAVLLHQEIPLELPDLVVVLLHGAHRVAGMGERRSSFETCLIHHSICLRWQHC